jgi:hypothetical protein
MSTIMVQVTDQTQTLAALHFACALARSNQGRIVLLKLIPVSQPGWLGTEWGYMNFTDKDQQALKGYEKVVVSHGIDVKACLLQVMSTRDGIISAADSVDAQIVFAQLSHSIIPFWHAWQTRILRRSLEQHQRHLYMLDYQGSPPDWKVYPALFDAVSNN